MPSSRHCRSTRIIPDSLFPEHHFPVHRIHPGMDLKLSGKSALVTGSTAGIGFAIASALAGEGARVIVNGRTAERVANAVQQLQSKHRIANVSGRAADLGRVEET